jgi:hypothetical protein
VINKLTRVYGRNIFRRAVTLDKTIHELHKKCPIKQNGPDGPTSQPEA